MKDLAEIMLLLLLLPCSPVWCCCSRRRRFFATKIYRFVTIMELDGLLVLCCVKILWICMANFCRHQQVMEMWTFARFIHGTRRYEFQNWFRLQHVVHSRHSSAQWMTLSGLNVYTVELISAGECCWGTIISALRTTNTNSIRCY